ncbi:MAG: copper amine oxidase N-terminal domain-containing protein [Clostridia bacterium]|nr:copper amine oxidase N-terminal domain-containing protein [Clostridia bacterium]
MKRIKYFIALFAALMMLTSTLPAFAVTHGSDSISNFTPPAGWENSDGVYRAFSKGDDTDIFAEEYYYLYYDIDSVRGKSAGEWESYFVSKHTYKRAYDDYSNVPSCSASFETINGYEYVKIVWTNEWYFRGLGETQNYIEYIYIDGSLPRTCDYTYRTKSSSMPYVQDFYNMMATVTYGNSPAQSSSAQQQSGNLGQQNSSQDISIYVNGYQVYPDSAPVIENDRTLVPIRAVAEELEYNVGWDNASKCVTLSRGNFAVQVMIDSTWITKYSGGQVSEYGTMDVPAKIINNRTYIPLRAVTEAMGCSVDWDGTTRSVYITE